MKKFNFKLIFRNSATGEADLEFETVNDAICQARNDMKFDNELIEIYISAEDIRNVTLSRRTLRESELITEHFEEFKKKNEDKTPGLIDAFLYGWKAEKNNTVDIIPDND